MIATAINNADLYTLITEQTERVGTLLRSVQAEASKNEAIINGIADGVLVIDAANKIQLINPALVEILNIRQKTLQNQSLHIILDGTTELEMQLAQRVYDAILAHQPELYRHNETVTLKITVQEKSIVVSLTAITLTANPNALPSTLVVIRDISREAELDRIKDEFISTVSHELRTPMTSIKGYTDLLVNNKVGELNEMQRHFVSVIKSNADRLAALVDDILDISRIDSNQIKLDLQPVDLTELIKSIIPSFNNQFSEKNLTLSLKLPAEAVKVYADPKRVTQVAVNLISNATKYTRKNDRITVEMSQTETHAQVDVSDTGLGIAAEDQKHVFDRFFRAERDAASLVWDCQSPRCSSK
jgi:signal transduction histidine kinase